MQQHLAIGVWLSLVGGVWADPTPKPEVNGKVPVLLTVEHFQPETVPARMPRSITDAPTKHLPTAGTLGDALLALTPTIETVAWQAIQANLEPRAKAALATAEAHDKACEAHEAQHWYQQVVKLAPHSPYAALAGERLARTGVRVQSAEPPLANPPELSELKLKVLWEAARQYKEAVEQGEPTHIKACAKVLEAALKATEDRKAR